jgi:transposase
MGQTRKRQYARYTLAFKLQAIRMANHPDVKSKAIAESLGIHPVMLYRWQMEHRRGELKASKYVPDDAPSPKRRQRRTGPPTSRDIELVKAQKRIKELERALASREEELDLLKKAQRFFAKRKKRSTRSSRRTATTTR